MNSLMNNVAFTSCCTRSAAFAIGSPHSIPINTSSVVPFSVSVFICICCGCKFESLLTVFGIGVEIESRISNPVEMSGTERYKRGREEEEEVVAEGKRFRGLTAEGEELLHLLEDVDSSSDRNLDSEDLVNGVMRSLEEEIGVAANIVAKETSSSLYDAGVSDFGIECSNRSGDSSVDLGYLLEASDDELGIPPTLENSSDDGCCVDILDNLALPSRGEYESLWHFEDQASDYGLLEYAYDVNRFNDMEGEREYVNAAAYTLFEHSDVDQSTWRREAACGI